MSLIGNAISEKPEAAVPLVELKGLSTHLGSLKRPVRAVDDAFATAHRSNCCG